MNSYKLEFLDFLTKKYNLNQKEVDELKNVMIKNDVSERRFLYLLKNKIK